MNAHPADRIARIISRRRSIPGSPARRWRRRALTLGAVGLAASGVLLTSIFASTSSAGAPGPGWAAADRDGLGIQPGTIKHVWLIILENKSYDATFTGLNNNTYLWQTLPSQGVLLKNYYGTGHFSLDNYVSLVSGQATQPDTQADCPYYDQFAGTVDTSGTLADEPELRPAGLRGGTQRRGRLQRLRLPGERADAVQPARRGAASAGRATPRTSATPTPSRPDPRRRRTVLRRARTRAPGPTASTAQANPGSANATDQYVPKHFPFPWFESILQSGRLQRRAHRQPVRPRPTASTTTCRARRRRRRSAGSRRTTAATPMTPSATGNNLSGGFSDPNTPNAAAQLHRRAVRRRPVPRARHSRDRGVAGVQGRRPDRRHLRRGLPAVHLHRQQLRQLDDRLAERGGLDQLRLGRETLFGHGVNTEPTGPNTPLAKDAAGNELYPGPGRQRVRRPPEQLRRPDGSVAAGGHVHPRRRQHVPGARAPTPGRRAAARTATIADNAIVATDAGRTVTGAGIPPGAFVGHGHRHADDRRPASDRPRRHRVLHARRRVGQAARHDRPR